MEVIEMNEDVLEVKEFSIDKIFDEGSLQKDAAKKYPEKLFKEFWNLKAQEKEENFHHLLWKSNGKIVGYAAFQEVEKIEAKVYFRINEEQQLSPNQIKILLEKSIEKVFYLLNLEKILFNSKKNHSSSVSRIFIEYFQPHPVGWVHLNDGKFVLTREQFYGTEKDFYTTQGYLY